MPRPERDLDPAAGPVQAFAAELRGLRARAGGPTYREMAAQAGYSVAALANAAGGRHLPSLPVTLAFVRACGGEPGAWERRWRQTAAEVAASNGRRPVVTAGCETPPYLGLIRYDVGDADRFFGRRRIVEQLVSMLGRHRLVAVFGASGSGKSSLLRAGLAAAMGGADRVVLCTPGAKPLTTVRDAAGRLSPTAPLLIVDQFEELYTLCADAAERAAVIAELAALAAAPGSAGGESDADGPRVVIGVRSDFYARCAESGPLAALLAEANLPVGPLTADELREVITEPARRADLTVERALVATILAEAREQPGALPMVSHALLETWRHRRGDVLTAAGYEAAGGTGGAIAQTAESVYQDLGPREQQTARQVLTRLVTLGDGVPDTRRRVHRDELDRPEVDAVLSRLARARLVVLGADTVELAHEVLIRAWPRLDDWLHADRDALTLHRRLTEAARIWQAHDRDAGALYRGAPLAAWDGRGLTHLNDSERAFLAAGRDRRTQEMTARQRRNRLTVGALTAGVLVLSLLAALAGVQAHQANRQRDLARSSQLVANARAQLSVDQELALLLAVEAFDTTPTPEAEAVLRQATADFRVRATVPTGQGQVVGVAYSPDGRVVASSGDDGTVRLWQAAAPHAPALVLRSVTSSLQSPVFSPDGQRLAVAGFDGLITVWDLGTQVPVTLRGHRDAVSTIAFTPDGRRLASASSDGTVRIWDVTTRRTTVELPVGGPPLGVAFSPDGRRLAVSGTGAIRIWDANGRGTPTVLTGHESTVKKIVFSPDGSRLASAGTDTTVRIWPLTAAEPPIVLRGNDAYVETVAFSPDGQRLASSHSGSNTVRVWSTTGDQDPLVLHGHDGAVWSLAFSPDGQRLVSGSSDGTIRFWDPGVAADPLVLRGHTGEVSALATDAAGRLIAAGGVDRTVRVWRQPWQQAPRTLRGSQDEVAAVAVSADGRSVAAGGLDRTVRVWDAVTGAPRAVFRGHRGPVWAVAFSPDGQRVASASRDGNIRVWSLTGAAPATLPSHDGSASTVTFSPDGRHLASAGADGRVRIRPADGTGTPTALQDLPPGRLVWAVAFSPDGRRLASSGQDGSVHLWSSDGRGPPVALRGHRDAVWSVAFSADGRLLVTSGQDGAGVRIWDAGSGRELVTVRGHGTSVHHARFLPDGRVVSAHGDGTVRIWSCRVCGPGAEVRAQAGALITRALTAQERADFLPR